MIYNQLQPYTLEIRHTYKAGFEQWYFLSSDWHWDNPKCDRALLKKHLDLAVERQAGIMVFGDLFCAMQGKYDKRSSKTDLRPEHQVNNYLDALVDTAAEWLEPYRENLSFISPGNHETALTGRHETDVTARLCKSLGVPKGTYQGWILLRFEQEESGGGIRTVRMAYTHGYGGGGPVTKDTIQASRRAVYLPDANIVVSGHTHDRWVFPVSRLRLKANGEQVNDTQLHLKLGNYKEEILPGSGWAIEKGHPPKQLGGIWLRFYIEQKEIKYEAILAQ